MSNLTIMRPMAFAAALALASSSASAAQTLVLQQPGFPAIESEQVPRAVLRSALGPQAGFVTAEELHDGNALKTARLLVLPYGSAFPVEAWPQILGFLHGGGNLLLLGGQPLRVPVSGVEGSFVAGTPQDTFSKVIDFRHSYAVPFDHAIAHFAWRTGYNFLAKLEVQATKVFAEEGRLQGLGYLDAQDGTHLAAPVIVSDHRPEGSFSAFRVVALPFSPAPGYWDSPDGIKLIHEAAEYAQGGATSLQIEVNYSAIGRASRRN